MKKAAPKKVPLFNKDVRRFAHAKFSKKHIGQSDHAQRSEHRVRRSAHAAHSKTGYGEPQTFRFALFRCPPFQFSTLRYFMAKTETGFHLTPLSGRPRVLVVSMGTSSVQSSVIVPSSRTIART